MKNNSTNKCFIDFDTEPSTVNYNSNLKGEKLKGQGESKFRKKVFSLWTAGVAISILTSFKFNYSLPSKLKLNDGIHFDSSDKKRKEKYFGEIPFFCKENLNTNVKDEIRNIFKENDKFELKKTTLFHLFNLEKKDTDFLKHVCQRIVKVSSPIHFNHKTLTNAKLKLNGKISLRNQQNLPNMYRIEKYSFDFIFNFFDQISIFDFEHIFNVKKFKRDNGRLSTKYYYYSIKELDRVNNQLTMLDSIYSLIDIKLTNNKWVVIYNFFHDLRQHIYHSKNDNCNAKHYIRADSFYDRYQHLNVNKYSILYVLNDFIKRDNDGKLISNDNFNTLEKALLDDIFGNEKIKKFIQKTEFLIPDDPLPSFNRKRKRSKDEQLDNLKKRKKIDNNKLETTFINSKYKNIEGYNEYLKDKKELKKEFQKLNWDEVEVDIDVKTTEFVEVLTYLKETCLPLDNQIKTKLGLARNEKWKKLKTKQSQKHANVKVFNSISDFKTENVKNIHDFKFVKHYKKCSNQHNLNNAKKTESETWSQFTNYLLLQASFSKSKETKNELVFDKLGDEIMKRIHHSKHKINFDTFASVYYVYTKTKCPLKASISLDLAMANAVKMKKHHAIAEIEE